KRRATRRGRFQADRVPDSVVAALGKPEASTIADMNSATSLHDLVNLSKLPRWFSEDGPRFAMELLVAAADVTKPFGRDAAKLAARPRQRVGNIGQGNPVLPREVVVRHVRLAVQVVFLEQHKGLSALPLLA